jgi:hypothetical protein
MRSKQLVLINEAIILFVLILPNAKVETEDDILLEFSHQHAKSKHLESRAKNLKFF